MKERPVIITIEATSNVSLKELETFVGETLKSDAELLTVKQIHAQVVQAVKK